MMPMTASLPLPSEEETTVTQQLNGTACAAGSIEQICVIDAPCGEGPHGHRTFAIHSSSTDDGFLRRFALEYPHDPGSDGQAERRNRRLALVRIPGGKSALIHTVFFPEAGIRRANTLFSHVLIHPALQARRALATWDSPDWLTSSPAEADNRMRPLTDLPSPGPVNDETLSRFLQDDGVEPIEELSALLCPRRLQAAVAQRRHLLRLVLRGCQLALQAGPSASRQRFYLLAEPELSALFFYAAARLLPEALVARFSFSTWESPHSLRGYKHARVVSTLTRDPADGLDDFFFTTGGYALDTFRFKWSPELEDADNGEIEDWIELASNGEWQELERIYHVLGQSRAIASFHEGRQAHQLIAQLTAGKTEMQDLVAAKNSHWGAAILDRHRPEVWPRVRDASLQDAVVRATFADWLADHLPELEQNAAAALQQGTAGNWRPHWQLLRAAVKEDVEQLRQILLRILPNAPYAPELRLGLLQELNRLQLRRADAPARFQPLLMHCTAEDLQLLARSDLDREWFVWALLHALMNRETASVAVAHLHGADDDLLRTFWEQFRLVKKEDQRRAILTPLFLSECDDIADAQGEGARFLSRALRLRRRMPADTLAWLLDAMGAWEKEWQPFWTKENHLSLLLDLIWTIGPGSQPIWERLCAQMNGDVLLADDPYQKALFMELGAAQSRGMLPPAAAEALADWIYLRQHFEKASSVSANARNQLLEVCERRKLDAIKLLARYFETYLLRQAFETEILDDFAGFFHSFFPDGEEYDHYSRRLLCWLLVVESCSSDEERNAACQSYYLRQHVPENFRWRLAKETYQLGKLLARVYESEVKPTETAVRLAPRSPGAAGLVQLSSIGQGGAGVAATTIVSRFVALLPAIAAGVLAVLVCSQFQGALRNDILVALFLPLLFALTDAVALQSAALSIQQGSNQQRDWIGLTRLILNEIRPGLILGTACGLVASGLAYVRDARFEFALAVGCALVASVMSAALLGIAVPLGLRMLRLETRLAPGITARAAAHLAGLLIYLITTCKLLT